MRAAFACLFGISVFTAGCVGGGSPGAPGGGSSPGSSEALDPDAEVFAGLPRGADSIKALCGRGHAESLQSVKDPQAIHRLLQEEAQ